METVLDYLKQLTLVWYAVVGFIVAAIFILLLKRHTLGGFLGGLAISVIGSILFGILIGKYVSQALNYLSKELNLHIVASIIGAWVLLWIYHKVTPRNSK